MDDISIKFIFNGISLMMQCKKNDYMKNIFQKYAIKINKNISLLCFLYEGDVMNKEAQLSKFIKGDKEIIILVVEFSEEEKNN